MHRFVLLTFMLGCGEVQKIPDDFAVTTDPTSVFVRRNQAQSVMVNVTRNSGTAPIDVTVDGLPNGVTADPLSIKMLVSSSSLFAGAAA